MFGFIFAILFLLFIIAILWRREPAYKTVGSMGEKHTANLIRQFLTDEDILLTNLELSFEGKRTELDNLVISKRGISIIEVKTYSGRIVGSSDDDEWDKYTTSRSGIEYHKIVRNPLSQVQRQAWILSSILREHGIDARVKAYVYFVFNNSPTEDPHILNNPEDLRTMLVSNRRKSLTTEEIRAIVNAILE